jgi:hypothetical protein
MPVYQTRKTIIELRRIHVMKWNVVNKAWEETKMNEKIAIRNTLTRNSKANVRISEYILFFIGIGVDKLRIKRR